MTHVHFNHKPFDKSFNSFVNDLFTDFPVLYKKEGNAQWKGFVPANIKETENSYGIDIVAPGFNKADFKVNIEQNVLTISAERKSETKEENEKEIRKEYNFRSFKRSFTLDEKIDAGSIGAHYVNGVLTLNLPKKETVKPATHEITIQ